MGEKVVENRGEGRNTVADDFAPTAFASSLGASRHLHREETAAGAPSGFPRWTSSFNVFRCL